MGHRARMPLIGLILSFLLVGELTALQQGVLPGDADNDGFLTPLDREAILNHILGIADAPGDADFNGDGTVDIADVVGLVESFFGIPATLVSIEVAVSDALIAPAGGTTLSWTIEGDRDLSGLEVSVRTREPGNVVTRTDATFMTSGVIPANGRVFYLAPAPAWRLFETAFGTGETSRDVEITLPSEAIGEWGFDIVVRDGDQPVGWRSTSIIAADRPGIRLRRSRPIANTIDPVRLELLTFNGADEGLITPLITLELPDGQQLSLPSFNTDVGFAESLGPGETRSEVLFEGLLPYGEGEYQLLARAFGSDNKIASMASVGLLVCDSVSAVSGRVLDGDGQPIDGSANDLATVRAFDIHDSSPVVAEVSMEGTYELALPAGIYRLSTIVGDLEGSKSATALVEVGCSGSPTELADFVLGESLEPLAGSGQTNPLQFTNKSPETAGALSNQDPVEPSKGSVLFTFSSPPGFDPDKHRLLEETFANIAASENPGIDTPGHQTCRMCWTGQQRWR